MLAFARMTYEVKRLGLGVAAGSGRLSLLYADDIVVLAESQEDL